MALPVFSEATLDDLLQRVFADLIERGERISPGKGPCREHFGSMIELQNPRARLSRSEGKGKIFSALGETCWYLSGSDDASAIKYYIKKHPEAPIERGRLRSAYGPRIFGADDNDQIENVVKVLRRSQSSRRAVAQIFSASDLAQAAHWNIEEQEPEVPCTCVLQFAIRKHQLCVTTYMRSNDVFRGLPHDIFAFTMIQELVARRLGIDVGSYRHAVGSLHLYEADIENANAYLREGWQSAKPMPSMPMSGNDEALKLLLKYESDLRSGTTLEPPFDLPDYWRDLAWLLFAFALSRLEDHESAIARMSLIPSNLVSRVFDVHIADKIGAVTSELEATNR